MVKGKKTKNNSKNDMKSSAKKNFGSKPIVWIVLGTLLVLVIVMLVVKDEEISSNNSSELASISDACFSYAQGSLRTEFCKYRLVDGDLINCRDSRILERLASDGIDINLGSLNCRSIDIYSYRKDVCSGYSVDTKIADTTCASYQ